MKVIDGNIITIVFKAARVKQFLNIHTANGPSPTVLPSEKIPLNFIHRLFLSVPKRQITYPVDATKPMAVKLMRLSRSLLN
jgi:hypothetical protein